MDYDKDKVDEMTLALMYLVMSRTPAGARAWKTFDVPTLDRLREKGWIANWDSRSATVDVTEVGTKKAEELFRQFFQSV